MIFIAAGQNAHMYIKPDMYNTVCNTNTTTNANEIKALTRVESEQILVLHNSLKL